MINIYLCDDQAMLRGAMVKLLNLDDQINVIGDSGDGETAKLEIRELPVDACIIDVEMPILNGLELAEYLKAEFSNIKIIMVTTFKRTGYFERALQIGVEGYVLKDRNIDDLLLTIHKVMTGDREYSPELMTQTINSRNPLTKQECETLKYVGQNLKTKQIAEKMHLSEGTIRNYLSVIIDKLNAESRFEAWSIAHKNGWIT